MPRLVTGPTKGLQAHQRLNPGVIIVAPSFMTFEGSSETAAILTRLCGLDRRRPQHGPGTGRQHVREARAPTRLRDQIDNLGHDDRLSDPGQPDLQRSQITFAFTVDHPPIGRTLNRAGDRQNSMRPTLAVPDQSDPSRVRAGKHRRIALMRNSSLPEQPIRIRRQSERKPSRDPRRTPAGTRPANRRRA